MAMLNNQMVKCSAKMWKSCPVQLALKVSWEQKQCKLWRASYSNPAAPTRHIPCARQQKVAEILRERAPATKETLRSESEHLRTKPVVWLRIAKSYIASTTSFLSFASEWADAKCRHILAGWWFDPDQPRREWKQNQYEKPPTKPVELVLDGFDYSLSQTSLPCLRQIAGIRRPRTWESSHRCGGFSAIWVISQNLDYPLNVSKCIHLA